MLKRTAVLLLLLPALLCQSCRNSHREIAEIIRLENRRVAARELVKFVMHPKEEVRKRAAIALGRSQDPDAVPALVELLRSGNPTVRVEAAFALGQLAQANTASVVLAFLATEKDLEVRLHLLEALGKVASDSSLRRIDSTLVHLLQDDIPIMRAEAALTIARLAHRRFSQPGWGAKLTALLQDDSEEVRWRCAYALFRLADAATAPALEQALQDRSSRVQMQAARALGVINDQKAILPLSQLARHDPDWRVRVSAAQALGNLLDPQRDTTLTALLPLNDSNLHVRVTALRALGTAYEHSSQRPAHSPAIPLLRNRIKGAAADGEFTPTWQEQVAAAQALATALGPEAVTPLAPLAASSEVFVRAGLAPALAATRAPGALPLLEKLAGDTALLVRIAALEALPKISAPAQALPIYLSALASGDQVLTAIAAQNLAADSSRRQEHALAIIQAYEKLPAPIDVEVAQMIFKALADCRNPAAVPLLEAAVQVPDKPFAAAAAAALRQLTGRDYSDKLPRETRPSWDFEYREISKLHGAWATVETDAGTFELQFFPEEAPLVTLNFVRLAQRGFFNGLLIHRVVPNFVIQTGDPRGDMWGSPGYSLRSEFNRLRYTRGMVGMASVGPDTEGSQWFITHSDQPHLDGRYTIFARVRKGMEVVDELQVGHRIKRITIHR
ncbi:MAG: HEAT repeat domain-containing protein [candidate division KSB1 bacterium]|nr:HEAT repeat domain-containing protein [candidate division KSB1 bacterium]MDZ7272893.1 HEAT repeat domain-containing protein [candidate division KSB1 bacterium]MDZ7284084.1 HEAT repeat domain-containing protein [candidate division KSB1 bacterium]MDZ7297518.1 HEAT repeat domain-containing protein [candidate division KSB1 bacterium]MDZ7308254.1 HEAT repeat domain-containing protein [candidate division KSB1 bacterium]